MCTDKNLIEVIMTDGTKCRMAPKALDLFLAVNRVLKFRRADGWATVGIDQLRNRAPKSASYRGPERRRQISNFSVQAATLPC